MRALHLATRLAGTDGVSLEAAKLARVLSDLGFERLDCAGEVETPGAIRLPEMHFRDSVAVDLHDRAFGGEEPDPVLDRDLEEAAARLAEALLSRVKRAAPDLLVVQNAWAIPMHLPLAAALGRVTEATGLPTLSHEHDYWWERARFARNRVRPWLDRWFPFDAPTVRHFAINTPAREALRARRGLEATVVPNVMDFGARRPGPDEARVVREEVRAALDLDAERRLILQPTRVVPRKGIELAIELLARIDDPRNVLVISHASGDEGGDTLARLRAQAKRSGVDLRYEGERFAPRRSPGHFALDDAYVAADAVSYPSLYEGFGNALLETIFHRRVAFVNRYEVYVRDIAPTGVHFVELDGRVDDRAARAFARLLDDPEERRATTEHNARVAARHFGMNALRARIEAPLRSLGWAA
jgi:glycosyltransferase involved in cell wall biosynthesis